MFPLALPLPFPVAVAVAELTAEFTVLPRPPSVDVTGLRGFEKLEPLRLLKPGNAGSGMAETAEAMKKAAMTDLNCILNEFALKRVTKVGIRLRKE